MLLEQTPPVGILLLLPALNQVVQRDLRPAKVSYAQIDASPFYFPAFLFSLIPLRNLLLSFLHLYSSPSPYIILYESVPYFYFLFHILEDID